MQKLTQSMFRFSWALSVLGVRQAANILTPRKGWDQSTESFDAISHAAEDQLGETAQSVYKAGDRFQSGMVDTVSRFAKDSWSSPGKAMNEAWESLDRTWTGVRHELTGNDSTLDRGND